MEDRVIIPGYCELCGEAVERNYRFCSRKCAAMARRGKEPVKVDMTFDWKKYNGRLLCRYQAHVSCIDRDCANCGWNPAVAEVRKRKYMEENHHGR